MISLFDAVAGCIFDLGTFNTHVPVKGSSCACAGGATSTASHSRTVSDASEVNFQLPTPNSQPLPISNSQLPRTPNVWELGVGSGWELGIGRWALGLVMSLLPPRLCKRQVGIRSALLWVD